MRIIQLPQAQSIQAGDVFAININGADYQVPVSLLVTAMQALGAYLTEDDLPLPVTAGGTGSESAQDARQALGITPANIAAVATADVANNLTTTAAGKVLDARQGKALKDGLDVAVLGPSAAFSIPASGSSVSYNLTGLTAQHELTRWNFSSSAENHPPVKLSWNTYAGYFTITNNGGSTTETIRPVFALPNAVAATSHT